MSRRSKRRRTDYSRRLRRLQDESHVVDIVPSPAELINFFDSPSGNARARAMMLARRQIEQGVPPEHFLQAAGRRLADADPIVRYEAGIIVSESLPDHHERVWQLFLRALRQVGADSRADLGCLLLEHLLEVDGEAYFLLCRQEVSSGNYLILDALEICWFADSGLERKAVQVFTQEVRQQLAQGRGAAQRAVPADVAKLCSDRSW